MNGDPVFPFASTSGGKRPTAAFTTTCQATKAAVGRAQTGSSRPGRTERRRRMTPMKSTMATAATATMTDSLVSAP
jgi:hypothetical protein